MRWSLFTLVLLLSLLAACGDQALTGLGASPEANAAGLSGDETRGPLPADADLATPPPATLSFGGEWNEWLTGVLYHGAEVQLSVDPSRFPNCGTWGAVTVAVMAGDEVTHFPLDFGEAGNSRWGSLFVPAAGDGIEVWLWTERDDGCVEYDSRFGHNYQFATQPWQPGLIRFAADWSETVVEPLTAGGALVIDYAWERQPDCRVVYRGFENWDILVHVAFDGEWLPGQSVMLPTSPNDRERVLAVFPIPATARRVEIYAENEQYPPTCHTWDSNYGRNYSFDIAP